MRVSPVIFPVVCLIAGCSSAAQDGSSGATTTDVSPSGTTDGVASDPSAAPGTTTPSTGVSPSPTTTAAPTGVTPTTSAPESSEPTTSSSTSDTNSSQTTSSNNTEPTTTSASTTTDPTTTGATTTDVETVEPNTECTLDVNVEMSEQIGTVAITTLTTDLGAVDGGYIEFGLDTQYGLRAPLDLSAESYRTLMLGMRQSSDYHYRVVVTSGDKACASADATLTTGAAPQGVPKPTLGVTDASGVMPGFIVTSNQSYILIFDHEGNVVWWYKTSINSVSSARMAWDGKSVFGRDPNPGANSGGAVVQVAIDGSSEKSLTISTGHHDLTATPDNGILLLTGEGTDGCSMIRKLDAEGAVSDVYDVRNAFGDSFKTGNDPCHCNSIHYNSADSSISLSCLSQNAYVKISEDGQLLWVLGGNNNQSHFTGDITWSRQHGHHMIDPNHILFFNNNGNSPAGGMGGGGGGTAVSSLAVEVELDLDAMTATRTWEYDGGESSGTFGDVQRLPNGHTFITYSNAGVMHEVTTDKALVQSYSFSQGTGYASHRESLYGPPPEL